MNFGFSEEQELLRAELRKFLAQNAPLEGVRRQVEGSGGFDRHLFDRMAELGWVGLTVPEAHGGMGLDLVNLLVVLEETGRTLFPSPLLSTVLAAKAIERAGSDVQRERWLPGLASGESIGTFAYLEESDQLEPEGVQISGKRDAEQILLSGRKLFVPDAGRADLFVVAFRSGSEASALTLAVVERGDPGVAVEDYPGMDKTKPMGALDLNGVRLSEDRVLGSVAGAWPDIAWILDAGAALVAGEMVGSAEEALRITTEYAKERIQFGEPIGRFQGVKHPLAEMHVDVESFKSLVYYAIWCLDGEAAEAPAAVSRAKAYASEALARIGIDGVQLHGGVGYTAEYDIQLYLKRSKWARPMFGDADWHYERLARLAREGGR